MRKGLFKRILFALYSWCFAAVDFIIPKRDDIWLFASHTGLTGNVRFFAQHLLEQFPDKGIYFVSHGNTPDTERYFQATFGNRVKLLAYKSLSCLFASLKAGRVFISHDLYRDVGYPLRRFRRRRFVLNLWHGIAAKKHWLLSKEKVVYPYAARARQFSVVVASSAADALAKAAVFGKALSDIWITGIPRNDILCIKGGELPRDLAEQERLLLEQLQGKALVLYAPTWRKFRNEFAPFSAAELEEMICLLAEKNAILGLRLHPKDEEKFAGLYASGAAVNLSSRLFPETQVVLRNTYLLVTDYSSIWYDYLLLNRPVIAYWYDYQDYSCQMGIIWDLPTLFPGKIAYSFPELRAEIRRILTGNFTVPDEYSLKYKYTRAFFHRFADGYNNQRLLNKMNCIH